MIDNPYAELGISPGATDEEVTKAYRQLAKKYHPDLNPGNAAAAEKMARINEAYEQIKSGKAGGSTYGGAYGSAYDNGSQTDRLYAAIARYINSGYFAQALNMLSSIQDKTAHWYYYSAVANYGAGNTVTALQHAKMAADMEPDNPEYADLLERMQSGGFTYSRTRGQFGFPDGSQKFFLWYILSQLFCCFCCR